MSSRLLLEGYDKAEINDAARAAWTAKKSIEQSASMKNWDVLLERIESSRRVLKRVVAPATENSASRLLKRSASLPK
jgi:nucleotidyltransferase/DNA polymerase involved in DNA repair